MLTRRCTGLEFRCAPLPPVSLVDGRGSVGLVDSTPQMLPAALVVATRTRWPCPTLALRAQRAKYAESVATLHRAPHRSRRTTDGRSRKHHPLTAMPFARNFHQKNRCPYRCPSALKHHNKPSKVTIIDNACKPLIFNRL